MRIITPKEIIDKYLYDQEVLKVLKEDGFKEVSGWDTTEELFYEVI